MADARYADLRTEADCLSSGVLSVIDHHSLTYINYTTSRQSIPYPDTSGMPLTLLLQFIGCSYRRTTLLTVRTGLTSFLGLAIV